jgi:acyl-CoA dehydrogenase
MSEMREEMLRTLDRVVNDVLTTTEREKADGGEPSAKLWSALVEQGMTELGETGSEIPFADSMAVARRAGYHAVPVALGETIAARHLLSMAGIAIPSGALTIVAPGASAAPYARAAGHAVRAEGRDLQLLALDGMAAKGANTAGEPRDEIDFGKARLVGSGKLADAASTVLLEGALLRSAQMAGALDRTLEHCMLWVNDRVQFGRPIAKFQAIQHHLAVLASETAAAGAAVEQAIEASGDGPDHLTVAIAKARVGESAGKAANIAHAVFGAMGFTREHSLHYSTRRLWAWRNEFGGEAHWQGEIGRLFAAKGGDRLWETLTARG